jgi:hypothetical protein
MGALEYHYAAEDGREYVITTRGGSFKVWSYRTPFREYHWTARGHGCFASGDAPNLERARHFAERAANRAGRTGWPASASTTGR